MNSGKQFDIFSTASDLDILFSKLPGQHGSKQHAVEVTRQVKRDNLDVVIIEKSLNRKFPFHVMVSGSEYTLNAFNCLLGAEQFVGRHQLNLLQRCA